MLNLHYCRANVKNRSSADEDDRKNRIRDTSRNSHELCVMSLCAVHRFTVNAGTIEKFGGDSLELNRYILVLGTYKLPIKSMAACSSTGPSTRNRQIPTIASMTCNSGVSIPNRTRTSTRSIIYLLHIK